MDAVHGDPALEQAPGMYCGLWRRAHNGASFQAVSAASGGPTLQQSVLEGLLPVKRTHDGTLLEEL